MIINNNTGLFSQNYLETTNTILWNLIPRCEQNDNTLQNCIKVLVGLVVKLYLHLGKMLSCCLGFLSWIANYQTITSFHHSEGQHQSQDWFIFLHFKKWYYSELFNFKTNKEIVWVLNFKRRTLIPYLWILNSIKPFFSNWYEISRLYFTCITIFALCYINIKKYMK